VICTSGVVFLLVRFLAFFECAVAYVSIELWAIDGHTDVLSSRMALF
jgi:hypothetical protein